MKVHETLYIDNLQCSGCAEKIRERLKHLGNIEQVHFDFDEGRIEFEKPADLDMKVIVAALATIGYPEMEGSGSAGTKTFLNKGLDGSKGDILTS